MSPEQTVDVTANKTLTADDCGVVQVVKGDFIVTLPATAAGLTFIIENGGTPITNGPVGASQGNESAVVTVNPQAADGISGLGSAAVINKDVVNTKATSKVGDRLVVVGSGVAGTAAYCVQGVSGTWDREA